MNGSLRVLLRACPGGAAEHDVVEGELLAGRPHALVPIASRSMPPSWRVNSISSGSPHVRPMWAPSTCGEPDEIKKNTHPKNITALFRDRVHHALHHVGVRRTHERGRPRPVVVSGSAVQLVLKRRDGGQFDSVWLPARTHARTIRVQRTCGGPTGIKKNARTRVSSYRTVVERYTRSAMSPCQPPYSTPLPSVTGCAVRAPPLYHPLHGGGVRCTAARPTGQRRAPHLPHAPSHDAGPRCVRRG